MRFTSRRASGLGPRHLIGLSLGPGLGLAPGLVPGLALGLALLLLAAPAAQAQAQGDGDDDESELAHPEVDSDVDDVDGAQDGGLEADAGPPEGAAEGPAPEDRAPVTEPPAEVGSHPSDVGFIVLGVGLGLMGVAVPLAGTAAYSVFQLEDECVDGVCPTHLRGARDTAEGAALATDVLLGVGGAATLAGLILLFVLTEEGEESPVQGAALCGPTGCELSLGGRF